MLQRQNTDVISVEPDENRNKSKGKRPELEVIETDNIRKKTTTKAQLLCCAHKSVVEAERR